MFNQDCGTPGPEAPSMWANYGPTSVNHLIQLIDPRFKWSEHQIARLVPLAIKAADLAEKNSANNEALRQALNIANNDISQLRTSVNNLSADVQVVQGRRIDALETSLKNLENSVQQILTRLSNLETP